MAEQTIKAVYENGVFRPLGPVGEAIEEGQKVHLRIRTVGAALQSLEELTHIYDGLSEEEIKELEQIILNRSSSFSQRSAEDQQVKETKAS